jgi:pilus assembly protein Flp/PilA
LGASKSFEVWVNRIFLKILKEMNMLKLLAFKNAYLKNEDGATAIEYGLIAAGIALAIVATVFAFGDDLNDTFANLAASMQAVEDSTATTVDPTSLTD